VGALRNDSGLGRRINVGFWRFGGRGTRIRRRRMITVAVVVRTRLFGADTAKR
jgi:hypothetical protein